MSNKYIGMTIGPIFATLNLTSSPAALWASSYIFSFLTRSICEILTTEYGVDEKDIVSPYYSSECELLNRQDGIGLFPDRIIFLKGNFDFNNMKELRKKAITKVSGMFNIGFEYLDEYIAVRYVEFEADNPIQKSSKYLDSIELATPYVFEEKRNPILALFNNDGSEAKNEAIKKIVKDFGDGFQLFDPEDPKRSKFRKIEEIVKTGSGFKRYDYYVIVRSDGDNMSTLISSLKDDETIRSFSKDCLSYCSEIAKLVGDYNGFAVYSGGDDLLAILPCTDKKGRTPFHFVCDANKVFKEAFGKYNVETSLSFGMTIAFNRFPLYESLEDSRQLLDKAKNDIKNCSVIRLQKHSGQSACLMISNSAIDSIVSFIDNIGIPGLEKAPVIPKEKTNSDDRNEILLSALYKLDLFEQEFESADDEKTVENFFINTFDAEYHNENAFVHNTLPKLLTSLKGGLGVYAIDNKGIHKNTPVKAMQYLLRMVKFFVEKEGKK